MKRLACLFQVPGPVSLHKQAISKLDETVKVHGEEQREKEVLYINQKNQSIKDSNSLLSNTAHKRISGVDSSVDRHRT